VVLKHLGMFIGFGVHRGEWRFTSTPDISAIVKSVLFATAVVAIAIFLATRLEPHTAEGAAVVLDFKVKEVFCQV